MASKIDGEVWEGTRVGEHILGQGRNSHGKGLEECTGVTRKQGTTGLGWGAAVGAEKAVEGDKTGKFCWNRLRRNGKEASKGVRA